MAILCKFPADSQEIRHLGGYLKDVTTKDFQPYFSITEVESSLLPTKIIIDLETVQKMTFNASFDIKKRQVAISSEFAVSSISLSILGGEELPISGFPKSLVARKVHKGDIIICCVVKKYADQYDSVGLSTSDAKMSRRHESELALRLSLSDEGSHEEIESLSTNYPEYQDLASEMKLAVFDFLQERITEACKNSEIVDPRITFLAEEIAVNDDVKKSRDCIKDLGTTILHIACAIGDSWLVELLIKSGFDIDARDVDGWTAYVVARVSGKAACKHLLREHMRFSGVYPGSKGILTPNSLSRDYENPIGSQVAIERDGLTVSVVGDNSPGRNIQVTSNHPIPPTISVFYFEINIIENSGYG